MYCLKPDHYRELQEAAVRERQERLQAAAQAPAVAPSAERQERATEGTPPALPKLSDLKPGEYERLGDKPTGCTEACPCRGRALGHNGQEIAICTDPARYRKLKTADTRASNKASRKITKQKMDALQGWIDALAEGDPRAMSVLLVSAMEDYRLSTPLDEAAKRHGVAFPGPRNFGYGRRDYRTLSGADALTQLKIGVEALLTRELQNAHDQPGQSTPFYDWLFGEEQASEEEIPQGNGGE